MEEGFISVNHVPTHIMTWGQKIEDKFSDEVKSVVIVITGNPGSCDFSD